MTLAEKVTSPQQPSRGDVGDINPEVRLDDMSDTFQTPTTRLSPAPVPVELPEVVWIDGHPTAAEPEPRGTRLRRCLLCNTRGQFSSVRCAAGLVVHLIDPADVAEAPEAFSRSAWAGADAIAGAHKHWDAQGFRVVRKPDGPTGEARHPRFRACPECNEEAMREGTLGPVFLTLPVTPRPPERGWRVRGRDMR